MITTKLVDGVWQDEGLAGWARFSDDRQRRYLLGRTLRAEGRGGRVTWIMLNPSTAGAADDDATIRRVTRFSYDWGFGRLQVVNLFPFIATDPRDLMRLAPHRPAALAQNDDILRGACAASHRVVCAWGADPSATAERVAHVLRLVAHANPREVGCLGRTKSGAPKHPLRLAKTTAFEPFSLETCQPDPSMPGSPSGSERRR